MAKISILTLLHSEQPKLYGVLAVLSVIGLTFVSTAPPSGAGDADTMVNGDDHKKNDIIMITGKAENCEAAKKALLVSLSLF